MILEVRDLSVHYPTFEGVCKAVNRVSLSVGAGEILGLVGDTGSGKSTAVLAILNLVRPPGIILGGEVIFEGSDLRKKTEKELREIRGKAIALIMQNPRAGLNPLVSIGNQIANLYMSHQDVSRKQALQYAADMLQTVGISDPKRRMQAYPHELSGGMVQRVLIAMALSCRPTLLVADDPTSGVDVTIQAQILDEMWKLVSKTSSATVIVSQDLGVVANYCERVAVMCAGQIVEEADVRTFFQAPRHPYVISMLGLSGKGVEAPISTGSIDLRALPSGCSLHPRCRWATGECRTTQCEMIEIGPNHLVRCHRASDV
jgi:oligopeptide/dipeptide ABC transporter ATP-binding protein